MNHGHEQAHRQAQPAIPGTAPAQRAQRAAEVEEEGAAVEAGLEPGGGDLFRMGAELEQQQGSGLSPVAGGMARHADAIPFISQKRLMRGSSDGGRDVLDEGAHGVNLGGMFPGGAPSLQNSSGLIVVMKASPGW